MTEKIDGAEKKRVLVADCNKDMRRLIRKVLQNHYAVVEVGTLADLRSYLDSGQPCDFLLIHQTWRELRILEADVLNVIRQFKGKVPEAKILVYSGAHDSASWKEFIRAGADRYLIKPIEPGEMGELVKELLSSLEAMDAFEKAFSVGDASRWIHTVLDNLPVGISIIDKAHFVVYFNEWQKNATQGEKGTYCWLAYHGQLARPPRCQGCPVERVLRDPSTAGAHKTFTTPLSEGVVKELDCFAYPFRNPMTGELVGAIECVIDVTERESVLSIARSAPEARVALKDKMLSYLRKITEYGYDRASLYLLSPDEEEIEGCCQVGDGMREGVKIEDIKFGVAEDPTTEGPFETGRVYIHERKDGASLCLREEDLGIPAALNQTLHIPLITASGKKVGKITVDNAHHPKRLFNERDTAFFTPFIRYLAGQIDSARELEDLQKHRERLEKVFLQEGNMLKPTSELDYLRECVKLIMLLGPSSCHVRMYENDVFKILCGEGDYYEVARERRPQVDLNQNCGTTRAWNKGEYEVFNDARVNPRWDLFKDNLQDERNKLDKVKSLAVFVIRFGQLKFGTIAIMSSQRNFFTESVCSLLEGIASRAAVMIDQMRRSKEEENQRVRLETLFESARLFLGEEDEEAALVVQLIAMTTNRGLGYNRAILFLEEGGRLKGRRGWGEASRDEADEVFKDPKLEENNGMGPSLSELLQDFLTNRKSFDDNPWNVLARRIDIPLAEGQNKCEQVQIALSKRTPQFLSSCQQASQRCVLCTALAEHGQLPDRFVILSLWERNKRIGAIYLDNHWDKKDLGEGDSIQRHLLQICAENASVCIQKNQLMKTQRERFYRSAHSFTTPLMPILSLASGIEDGIITEPGAIHEAAATIRSSADRFKRSVNQMLTEARLREGRIDWKDSDISMPELIHEAIANCSAIAEERKVELLLGDNEPVTIRGDREKLLDSISTFIENAIVYSKGATRGGKVTVRSRDLPEASHYELTVADNGIGIPEKALDLMGKEPFRTEEAMEMQRSGMGLGVYLANRVIAHYGGTLDVQSELNKGTTVTVRIPLSGREK